MRRWSDGSAVMHVCCVMGGEKKTCPFFTEGCNAKSNAWQLLHEVEVQLLLQAAQQQKESRLVDSGRSALQNLLQHLSSLRRS